MSELVFYVALIVFHNFLINRISLGFYMTTFNTNSLF